MFVSDQKKETRSVSERRAGTVRRLVRGARPAPQCEKGNGKTTKKKKINGY